MKAEIDIMTKSATKLQMEAKDKIALLTEDGTKLTDIHHLKLFKP